MTGISEIKKQLELAIHGEEVFGSDYSPPDGFEEDLQGWFAEEKIYGDIIDSFKPKIIIEVGTWKGASALYMTERMKKHNPDSFTICVDTWLGSTEHRMFPNWRDELKIKNGRPQLYEQFLFNVAAKGLTQNILPIPLPSDQAAKVLSNLKMKVPFIYIDAAHDEQNVKSDIENFWELLVPGGIMLGDDYSEEYWPGLVKAVHDFVQNRQAEIKGELKTVEGKWLLVKA